MEIDLELIKILVCPICKTSVNLTENNEGLICPSCNLIYPIKNSIPVMLKEEAACVKQNEPKQ